MAHQPTTPGSTVLANSSTMSAPPQSIGTTPNWNGPGASALTPSSSTSSNNTYLMPASPAKGRRSSSDGYRPKISKTVGQRPACLVNASVTFCGDDMIYAFGGFDQFTDEGKALNPYIQLSPLTSRFPLVYNHVLKLDLKSLQWHLVDNYGDIPGVRMGQSLVSFRSQSNTNSFPKVIRLRCTTGTNYSSTAARTNTETISPTSSYLISKPRTGHSRMSGVQYRRGERVTLQLSMTTSCS